MNILEKIVECTKERVQVHKAQCDLQNLKAKIAHLPPSNKNFELALRADSEISESKMKFICEVKKASPSKGVIAQDFDYLQIALDYENAGAHCISCLTEPQFFLGSDEYLRKISESVRIPTLRKDFVIDEYMIYEARFLGASAVLLIADILSSSQLGEYLDICQKLDLSALVEVHNENDLQKALDTSAHIIGINNRDLKTFETTLQTTKFLREFIPKDKICVSESGINTRADIEFLQDLGVNAVLIGEHLMRQSDKKRALDELKMVRF